MIRLSDGQIKAGKTEIRAALMLSSRGTVELLRESD
jgi:hypothetical protein